MKGRKPKPRDLRLLEGNPARRPLPPPDPSRKPLGNVPRDLTDREKATWRRVKAECPWLKRADRLLVEMFCRAWFQMDRAERNLLLLVAHQGDPARMSALQRMLNQARAACERYMAEMGATPSARIRLMRGADGREDDVAAQYFGSQA